MHSMQQKLVFSSISRHLCPQGEVVNAEEGFIWFGTPPSPVFLRETYAR